MIYVFLADGFEEIEALAPIDILRRCGKEVTTVSVTDEIIVEGAHGIPVVAETIFDEVDLSEAEALIVPGGMPGAAALASHIGVQHALVAQAAKGGLCCAICAGPMGMGQLGLLKGRRATCYPGFEDQLEGATYTAALVEEDGSFITAKGPAAACEFGFAIARRFVDAAEVEKVQKGMMF